MVHSPQILTLFAVFFACSPRRAPDAAITAHAPRVGPVAPRVEATSAAPETTAGPGGGLCRVEGDCVPLSCCAAVTPDGCVARADRATGCEAEECPAPVVSELRCACRGGRCAGVR